MVLMTLKNNNNTKQPFSNGVSLESMISEGKTIKKARAIYIILNIQVYEQF